jgi:hypothetical protein
VKTHSQYVRFYLNSSGSSLGNNYIQSAGVMLRFDIQPTRDQKLIIPASSLDLMRDKLAKKMISVTDGEILKGHAIS